MVDLLARNWWLVILRGVAALIFGLLTLFNPPASLAVMILFFGAYALVYGAFAIFTAIANRRGERYWMALLVGGLASLALGVLTFLMPGVTALVLLYFIAAWALLTGISEIVAGIRLRKVIRGEWLLVLTGVLSIVFGVLLFVYPGAGALAVTLWIGAYATVIGILLIALGFRLRSWRRTAGSTEHLRTA